MPAETATIALAGLGGAIVGNIGQAVMIWLSSRMRSREKQEDWRQNKEVSDRLLASNKVITEQNAHTINTVNHIKTLVNSNLTEQKERAATAIEAQILATDELFSLKRQDGREPAKQAIDALEALRREAHALRLELVERATAADQAAHDDI